MRSMLSWKPPRAWAVAWVLCLAACENNKPASQTPNVPNAPAVPPAQPAVRDGATASLDRAPAVIDAGMALLPQRSNEERMRAASMDEQLKALGALKLADGEARPPANADLAVWRALIPADNAPTAERVALGKKLYFDTRLSADNSVSCATCHDVTRGFVDLRPVSEGIKQQLGRRNAPTTLNAALMHTLFLDGRAASLEAQAQLPITNPVEMGQPNEAAAVAAIAAVPEYTSAFQTAYGRPVNMADIGRAIASFERTLVFLDAPFDRFTAGDASAMSANAKAGWELFNGKARCNSCHQVNPSSPLFTDNRFHNIGVAARHQDFASLARKALGLLEKNDSAEQIDHLALETDMSELGRFMVTRKQSDIGAFRTLQLRNVGLTPPYMHDGSMQTLWDVMDHYNKGGEANPYLDGGIEPLDLSEQEIDQLVAFMFALTDVRFDQQNLAEFQRQRAIANTRRPFRDESLAHRQRLPFEPDAGIPVGQSPLQGVDP